MSEQSDKPAKETKTTDSASDAKTGETTPKTSKNEAMVKADEAREKSKALGASEGSSLDIPSSKDSLSGTEAKATPRSKAVSSRQSTVKPAEKGLFESPDSDSERKDEKIAPKIGDRDASAGTTQPKDKARKTTESSSSESRPLAIDQKKELKTKAASEGSKRNGEKNQTKKTAESSLSSGKASDSKKSDGGNLKNAASDKKTKVGSKQKPGTRMTSGGDPTIERKAALTTTTPIRKRKSDGGGFAVLIALLVVVVAAGYYFLTQTGGLEALRSGDTPRVVSSEPEVPDSDTAATSSIAEPEEPVAPEPAPETPAQKAVEEAAAAAPEKVETSSPKSEEASAQDSASVQTANAPTETPGEIVAIPDVPIVLNEVTLKEIEDLLLRLQIDPGPADGVIDNRTAIAIRLYQEIAGLPVDGKTSPDLLIELREVVELLSNE